MNSGLINKIEKAKRYAQEPERITFQNFQVSFRGDNGDHTASYNDGTWECTCNFFSRMHVCCHTMALQKILGIMLPVSDAMHPFVEELNVPDYELAGS